ncbi:hypothetical protein ACNANX_10005 (plasmid) [Campylobacter coli]
MNVVLLILTIIFIFLLCNYLYRKAKGVPDKPLKEIQDELKLEWIKYKQEKIKRFGIDVNKKSKKLMKNLKKNKRLRRNRKLL